MSFRRTADPGPEAAAHSRPLSEALLAIASDTSRERIAVADLLVALQDRALAALLLLFAFPNAIPVPPGTSAILGAPLLFLSAQLALGRGPWLPRFIGRRSIARTSFAAVVARAVPWLARAERSLRPRLTRWTRPPAEHLIGLVCLFLAIVLVLPVPLGNMLPALAICLFSLGILEGDGVWVLAGAAVSLVATALVAGVLFGLARAGFYLFSGLFA
ncbi:exopolysaccharide biosynthesis protein [Caldimonas tepidiphila]|uniref:exopolysaccharide biosynthesis protein n=1 Tax=Caldimonas tepidiphila TaxID=2315841 RepID=UPI000E5AFA59|nr:exopolysaccharide biosynthesis protein [Caldimonas tepidiphila]